MTPLRGRGFVVHSTKKPWTKPALRTFENPEEAVAYYRGKATSAEKAKIEKLLECMPGSRGKRSEKPELRRSAKR